MVSGAVLVEYVVVVVLVVLEVVVLLLEEVVEVGDTVIGVRLGDGDGGRLRSTPFRSMMLLVLSTSLFGEYREESWESGLWGLHAPASCW